MTDLRECPFCGLGNAMLLGSGGVYWVECRDCLCQTHTRTTEKTAREAWNRRVQKTPEHLRALVDAIDSKWRKTTPPKELIEPLRLAKEYLAKEEEGE